MILNIEKMIFLQKEKNRNFVSFFEIFFMSKRVKNIVKFLPLLLFVWHFCSANLFTHEHIINGVKVVHSHISNNAKHQHSACEFSTIYSLTHFNATRINCFITLAVSIGVLLITSAKPQRNTLLFVHLKCCLFRGPPAI